MTIYPETEIINIKIEENLHVGEDTELSCEVHDHNLWKDEYNGTISWMKNNVALTTFNNTGYIIKNNSLRINNLGEDDSGSLRLLEYLPYLFMLHV